MAQVPRASLGGTGKVRVYPEGMGIRSVGRPQGVSPLAPRGTGSKAKARSEGSSPRGRGRR